MNFLDFEKNSLQDLIIAPEIDYSKEFDEEDKEALFRSFRYWSPQYLGNGAKFFPSNKNANRIELTFFLKNEDDILKNIAKIHESIIGSYTVYIDFYFTAVSDAGCELKYPR